MTNSKKILIILGSVIVICLFLELILKINKIFQKKDKSINYNMLATTSNGLPLTTKKVGIRLLLNPFMVYKNMPKGHRLSPKNSIIPKINSLGFRGEKEVSKKKHSDSFRIIVIGGSAAFGEGASSDNTTWEYILENKLNNRKNLLKKVEILNAGVIGYLSGQELIYLVMELIDLAPDLVIVYNGWNDFYDHIKCQRKNGLFGFNNTFFEIEKRLLKNFKSENNVISAFCHFFKYLINNTELAKNILPRIVKGPKPEFITREYIDAFVKNYGNNIEKMSRFSHGYSVEFVVAFQPELYSKNKKMWTNEEINIDISIQKGDPEYRNAVKMIYPLLAQKAKEICRKTGSDFLDLRKIFDTEKQWVFADFVHTNDNGNEIIAKTLYDHLISKYKNKL
ncbi:MAG: SGNH/GDSL hydrolase family protein [Elusimicrobiota bacterium]